MSQRRKELTAAVPLIPRPHRLIRPPVATSANPTMKALELVELIWMRVIEDSVLVMISPDIGRAQSTSLPAHRAPVSPPPGNFPPPPPRGRPIPNPLTAAFSAEWVVLPDR